MIYSNISHEEINCSELITRVQSNNCGAINIFIGTVRNSSPNASLQENTKQVLQIEYSAYLAMAQKELNAILTEAQEKFGFIRVAAQHRTGLLQLGETAVAIVVATPHRDAAFQACRFIIEELKQRVPIWKKEFFDDNTFAISQRP